MQRVRDIFNFVRRLIAIALWGLVGRGSAKPSERDYRRHIWKDSASGLGLRMTERLRDAWRNRWLKITKDNQ